MNPAPERIAGTPSQGKTAAAPAVVKPFSFKSNHACNVSGVGSAKNAKSSGNKTIPTRRQPWPVAVKPMAASNHAVDSHQSSSVRGSTCTSKYHAGANAAAPPTRAIKPDQAGSAGWLAIADEGGGGE